MQGNTRQASLAANEGGLDQGHLTAKPNNLVIRFSAPMVDQRAPEAWPNSSEVVTSGASCPAASQDNECRDCRQCWDPNIKVIKYGKH